MFCFTWFAPSFQNSLYSLKKIRRDNRLKFSFVGLALPNHDAHVKFVSENLSNSGLRHRSSAFPCETRFSKSLGDTHEAQIFPIDLFKNPFDDRCLFTVRHYVSYFPVEDKPKRFQCARPFSISQFISNGTL